MKGCPPSFPKDCCRGNGPVAILESMIDVVDVFAGPGGLGEGFSSAVGSNGRALFAIKLSVEKNANAHATLRLRAFRRLFGGAPPPVYWRFVRGECSWADVLAAEPGAAKAANAEALLLELGPGSAGEVGDMIRDRISPNRPWVLVGGPPCQAYSLVGRSRNRGNAHYRPSRDRRHVLYLEYLQILSDHAPPVFVMENVKGLLSARYKGESMLDRILEDLRDPDSALKREGRAVRGRRPQYGLVALTHDERFDSDDPRRFIVRAENYGVPQRRHRVIVLGIRHEVGGSPSTLINAGSKFANVGPTIAKLPRLRSGVTGTVDSFGAWIRRLEQCLDSRWMTEVSPDVAEAMRSAVDHAAAERLERGIEVSAKYRVLNHSSRGHMDADLHRYLFASAFASVHKKSPTLDEFPRGLLPLHKNAGADSVDPIFADRFRVQVKGEPATTITSHIAKDGHYYIHHDPTQCRSLTVREAARLQTFPDDYFFCGPRTAQYHQVGNAVPPLLAGQIAGIVSDLLK